MQGAGPSPGGAARDRRTEESVMTKYRRASRAARVLLPGAVAVVLLTGCAQGSGGAASATGRASPAGVSPTRTPSAMRL